MTLNPGDPGYLEDLMARVLSGRLTLADVSLKETYVLEKFDGDPPRFPGEKRPVERITFDGNGDIARVERFDRDADTDPPGSA